MIKILTCFFILLINDAFANPGRAEAGILAAIISGNIGLTIGIAACAFGLYQALIQQRMWGWVVILGGIAFTAFPTFYKASYVAINPAIDGVTGGSTGRSFDAY